MVLPSLTKADLATDWLSNRNVLEILSAILIEERDGVCLRATVLLVNGDYKAAVITHAEGLERLLLLRFA